MLKSDKTSDVVVDYLINYLLLTLDELTIPRTGRAFDEGAICAYVECLEVLSQWQEFPKFGISDIEKKYPVK
ncbi:MAG: hypothetical protein HDQ88_06485 [Clostridia bacterium]|nr:hypothetical protein [Clostridia bacterium]